MKRIQRRRTKNWKAPSGTVYVGRPTRWGNPFKIDSYTPDRRECIAAFERGLIQRQKESPLWFDDFYLIPLKDKKYLSCWCSTKEWCHADVWIGLLREREAKREDEHKQWQLHHELLPQVDIWQKSEIWKELLKILSNEPPQDTKYDLRQTLYEFCASIEKEF